MCLGVLQGIFPFLPQTEQEVQSWEQRRRAENKECYHCVTAGIQKQRHRNLPPQQEEDCKRHQGCIQRVEEQPPEANAAGHFSQEAQNGACSGKLPAADVPGDIPDPVITGEGDVFHNSTFPRSFFRAL